MKMMHAPALAALASATLVSGASHAAVITPTGVTATTWVDFTGNTRNQEPINLINGSRFNDTGDPFTSTHGTEAGADGMWHSSNGQGTFGNGVIDDQEVTFDLGGSFELNGAYIWQFNQTNLTGRGVDEFVILASTDGGATYGLTIGTFNLNEAGNTSAEPVQFITFAPTVAVTHIKFNINTNHNEDTSGITGLSEVRFSAVPEPGSLALLGLGSIFVMRRRRG